MRSRSLRISITIILIFGVAIAALGFKDINIDIPGIPRIERESVGPLGLKLGLDLRGGGHLVYQADTGTKFEVTFVDHAHTLFMVRMALRGGRGRRSRRRRWAGCAIGII